MSKNATGRIPQDTATPTARTNQAGTLHVAIEKLQSQIDYENAMYESASNYPTDTPQFYHALEETRQRINGMYAELDEMVAELKATEEAST